MTKDARPLKNNKQRDVRAGVLRRFEHPVTGGIFAKMLCQNYYSKKKIITHLEAKVHSISILFSLF